MVAALLHGDRILFAAIQGMFEDLTVFGFG